MTRPRDIRQDLEPDAPEELIALAERLARERPVPSASFRGDLRRRLLIQDRPRPARLRLLITAYASSGATLLFVGLLSAVGVGPLAA
jgi:hypothetical protein